jgi:uncharacterized protein (TIGR02444 family)
VNLSRVTTPVLGSRAPTNATQRQPRSIVLLQTDNPFWAFSLAVYGKPGVSAECLALQRALGIDVNMLLFCAWLGAARGVSVTASDIDAFEAIVRPWHESVVRALRRARDAVKAKPEMAHDEVKALREQILDVELRAEQVEQAMLFQAAAARPSAKTSSASVRANLRAYLARHRPDGASLSIERLVAAADEMKLKSEEHAS